MKGNANMKKMMFFILIFTLLMGCSSYKIKEIEIFKEFDNGTSFDIESIALRHDGENVLNYDLERKQIISTNIDSNIYNPKKELEENKTKFNQYMGMKYEYTFDEEEFIAYIKVEVDFSKFSPENYNEQFSGEKVEKNNYSVDLKKILEEHRKQGYIIYK